VYHAEDNGTTIEIQVEDVDQGAIFSEALIALSGVMTEARGGTAVTHEVEIAAAGPGSLLREWVDELIRLAERDGFIAERAYRERLDGTTFRARVAGEKDIPAAEIRRLRCRSVALTRLPDGAWGARISLDGGA
jgi:hypothetical protein